jgi:hypothetical protein
MRLSKLALRRIWLACFYIGLIWIGFWMHDWMDWLGNPDDWPISQSLIWAGVAIAIVLFVILSAIPFVPGVEIGLGLLIVFGSHAALLVYLCMVLALFWAFSAGRFISPEMLIRTFSFFHFNSAKELVEHLAPLNEQERLDYLCSHAPTGSVPFLLAHRYVFLGMILNVPGNGLVGGGGGIAFMVGMSGLFSLNGYILTLLIAVAPVPLLFYLFA